LNAALREAVREQEARAAAPTAAILDSQLVKTSAVAGHAATMAPSGDRSQAHILVDVLAAAQVVVTTANVPEREAASSCSPPP